MYYSFVFKTNIPSRAPATVDGRVLNDYDHFCFCICHKSAVVSPIIQVIAGDDRWILVSVFLLINHFTFIQYYMHHETSNEAPRCFSASRTCVLSICHSRSLSSKFWHRYVSGMGIGYALFVHHSVVGRSHTYVHRFSHFSLFPNTANL